ncbi:MAG: 2-hydroxyacyl-CoA dehydratase [Syntrophaceae bacterium]|nr:2-hydroxyacyl-CoA dehydratase [Syntrophaceae bacterium]
MPRNNVFSKVERYYRDYGARAKELKAQGIKVIAYLCSLTPIEIITAAGFLPLRIRGDTREPITIGDTKLETIACPFLRSCFDVSLKGRYDFCDGLIIPHACDSITRTYSVWRYSIGITYSHFVNLPHKVSETSLKFFKAELTTFKNSLERFADKKISDEALAEAIDLNVENRKKVKALYQSRKSNPPPISGAEIGKILTAGMGLPVSESNELFDECLRQIKLKKEIPLKKRPRIMILGSCLDNVDLITFVEDAGADVVVDSLCMGTRDYWRDIGSVDDPMRAIALLYLNKMNCPRTYREKVGKKFREDAEARFGDIGLLINEFKVEGVILYVYRNCDPFGFEVPARKEYLSSLHIPVLYLEGEYSSGAIGHLKTRIKAFLELIG